MQRPDFVGQQFGSYRLLRLLGAGGFAEVYLGEHIHLGTQAAIKVLHTQLTDSDVEAFRTEARTIARLIHPHIIRVLDFNVAGSTPFLVMDYAAGGTTRERYPRGTKVPFATIVSYIQQVTDALQYAHDEKLIHRDIKPENILLDERQNVLLSDFGIALVAQSSRYQNTQDVIGTAAYMSPEQIQGKPRPASDQYSLGVVIYEWLSGTRPFAGSLTELWSQHIFAPPPPLHEKVPTISPEIEHVVMTALQKDPKQRFGTIRAFANALQQAGQTEQLQTVIKPQISKDAPANKVPSTTTLSTQHGQIPMDSKLPSSNIYTPASPNQPVVKETPPTLDATRPPAAQAAPSLSNLRSPVAKNSSPSSFVANFTRQQQQRRRRKTIIWGVSIIAILLIISLLAIQIYFPLQAPGKQKWTFAIGGVVTSTPATANGTVYIGSPLNDYFYAIDAASSQEKWVFTANNTIGSSPTVVDNVVYFGSDDGKLYALNASSGVQEWAFPTGGEVLSSPTVVNNVAYFGSRDGKLYALDASSGVQKWAFPTGGEVLTSPKVVNNVVYFGSRDGKLYALDASSGKQKWAFTANRAVESSPIVANNTIYFGSNGGSPYALNTSGQQKWSFPTKGAVGSSPTVANGVVYFGSDDDNFYAVDASSGKQKWAFITYGQVSSSATVADNVVYFSSQDGNLYALYA